MVRNDRSMSGTHLLCAVGRYQEACSQVDLIMLTSIYILCCKSTCDTMSETRLERVICSSNDCLFVASTLYSCRMLDTGPMQQH